MKINPKYGDKIISIPSSQVMKNLKEADGTELKVLIFALSEQNASLDEYCDALSLEKEEVKRALSFWKERGVFSVTGLKGAATKKEAGAKEKRTAVTTPAEQKRSAPSLEFTAPPKAVFATSNLPVYSSDEITSALKRSPELSSLIDECNNICKRMLNVHEIGMIVSAYDYLSLGSDYIMLLCSYVNRNEKKSFRDFETQVIRLYDGGIRDYAALEEYIELMAQVSDTEAKIRRLFGMQNRQLTDSERSALKNWVAWGVKDEMIDKAYEITVDNTSKPNVKYMNKIIENWHTSGITTPEEADKASEDYKKLLAEKTSGRTKRNKNAPEKETEAGSFNAKDFYLAALKRSYGDNN